jgi:hypothetical protein
MNGQATANGSKANFICQLARYMFGQLSGVPDKLRLQIDAALVRKHKNRPQAVRQFVAKFRFAVVNGPDAGVCLDQFCQIAYVPHETKD